jgi:hypothetical protein
MAGLRSVKTLVSNVVVPGYGRVDAAQTTVSITNEAFAQIPAGALGVQIQDMGGVADPSDLVSTQAPFVAVPAAVTSVQEATANANTQTASYVQADVQTIAALANSLKIKYNAAQADIAALRGTVASLLVALKGSNKPMSPS